MKNALLIAATLAAAAASAQAVPTINGSIDVADGYGAPVKTYVDQYVNGSDASSGLNTVSTYFTFDATKVYGAIHFDSGAASPFPGSNVYMYSSTANTSLSTGLPGTYGDLNDIIAEGANGWGYASPSGIIGGIHYSYSPATVDYISNGTDTVEFSIARSLLGDYDSFRYGGQLFAYEFHTGSGDRQPGALLAALGLASVFGLRRRRA
jgi:MYXO-CTERM domain-containing protein